MSVYKKKSHGEISQRTAFFIVTAVKISNPTDWVGCFCLAPGYFIIINLRLFNDRTGTVWELIQSCTEHVSERAWNMLLNGYETYLLKGTEYVSERARNMSPKCIEHVSEMQRTFLWTCHPMRLIMWRCLEGMRQRSVIRHIRHRGFNFTHKEKHNFF
jgi:hypothetical protein